MKTATMLASGLLGLLCVATIVDAQCTPTWTGVTVQQGVGDGYAGPMAVWNAGAGEGIYVGGSFSTIGGATRKGIARWNPVAGTWTGLAQGCFTTNTNYFVAAIAPYDVDGPGPATSQLYVGGSFATASNVAGTQNLARWNGATWSSLGQTPNGAVWSLATWNGRLYVGGGFTAIGSLAANGIASWDGESWSAVGSGFGGGFAPAVFAMRAFNDGSGDKLYAVGRFTSIGGVSGMVARWTGSAWEPVGAGVTSSSPVGDAEAIAVFDDDGAGPNPPALYVGGGSLVRTGFPDAAHSVLKWDGTAWSIVGQDMGGRTTSLVVFDDGSGPALYAGGTAQPGVNYFARLVNGQWTPAAGGVGGTGIPPSNFPSVFGALAWGERLIVAGNFTTAGPVAARGLAIYNGCPPCRADFNADGTVNSQDVFDFLAAYFVDSPRADFNVDGLINSQDFFDFLAVFFPGC